MIHYIFDPEVVDECALKCIGHPKPGMFDVFAQAMEERYPGHIDKSQPWIYSIAGGAMIQMKLYFASLYEYIMIWGTPIGSEGHSGRHHVAFWDTVIDGETWYYAEGQFEKRIYRPGDRIFVGRRQAVGMNFTDGVWAVEYERGFLPRSVPFGLADELLSARDFVAAKQTLAIYTALIGRHWAAPYNHDYPLVLPFKRLLGPIMRAMGTRTTKRLTPPPPKELPRAKPFRPAVAAQRSNGRRAAAAGGVPVQRVSSQDGGAADAPARRTAAGAAPSRRAAGKSAPAGKTAAGAADASKPASGGAPVRKSAAKAAPARRARTTEPAAGRARGSKK